VKSHFFKSWEENPKRLTKTQRGKPELIINQEILKKLVNS